MNELKPQFLANHLFLKLKAKHAIMLQLSVLCFLAIDWVLDCWSDKTNNLKIWLETVMNVLTFARLNEQAVNW